MSIQLKLRGGTTAQHSSFEGSAREVTVDTDKNTLVVHGVDSGGAYVGTPLLTAATDSTVIPSVTTTPTSGGSVGETVFNTTDGQLYRHNGTIFEIYAGVSGTVNAAAPVVDDLLAGSYYFNTTNDTLYVLKDITGTLTWTQAVPSVTASGNGIEVLAALPAASASTEGRMVFLTTDDKLYRFDGAEFIATIATSDLTGYISAAQINANTITASHITANAVTAGKILAGEIGTSHLAANAITAGTIATNAITSDKIIANAIGAGKIAAGVISTVHMGANSILAGAITAGSLSMAKMTSTSELVTNDVTVQLGAGSEIGGYTAGGAYDSENIGKYGLLAVNSAAGHGIGCGTTATSGDYAGCVGVGAGFSIGGEAFKGWKTIACVGSADAGVMAAAGPGSGTAGIGTETARIQLAKGAYAYYITTGSNSPFTGAHDTLIPNGTQIEQGDIVIDESTAAKKSVSDTIAISVPSTTERQKGALGVFVQYSGPDHVPASLSMMIEGDGLTQKSILNPSHQALMDQNQVAVINSLGEGQINCCGEGGNLEIGDLIVTSSIPGKGMRQADDIVRSMTVAKVREDVTFANGEVKMVACIYLCG